MIPSKATLQHNGSHAESAAESAADNSWLCAHVGIKRRLIQTLGYLGYLMTSFLSGPFDSNFAHHLSCLYVSRSGWSVKQKRKLQSYLFRGTGH